MSLHKIRDFLQGNANYFSKESLPEYITEQVELRSYLCQPCLSNGKCTHCGCKTPNMFYSPNKVDSEQKWAEFLSENQWNALKANIHEYAKYFELRSRIEGGDGSDTSVHGQTSRVEVEVASANEDAHELRNGL